MKMVASQKYKSIADAIYEKVFDRIVSGKLRPGEKLTEQDLAEAEGVSRAPVREAFKRLAEDRLIVLSPRRGCNVCELTEKDVIELYDIRKRLEGLALEYAFGKFDLARVRELMGSFEACMDLSGDDLARKATKLDSKLHSLIFETAGSEVLKDVLAKILTRVRMFMIRATLINDKTSEALRNHLDILNAILTGDRARAFATLNEHIDISKENALQSFKGMAESNDKESCSRQNGGSVFETALIKKEEDR